MPTRLEQLYRQRLVKPEGTGKVLPLEHILKRPLLVEPQNTLNENFDFFEVGTGNGEFITGLGKVNPTKKIVGIELDKQRFEKTIARLKREAVTNVAMICGDARTPFHKSFGDNTFEKGFVLFPDPWPKNKHRHNRLLQRDFIEVIIKKFKVGGELILATDVKDYAVWAEENFSQLSNVKNTFGKHQLTQDLNELGSTYFQRKWQQMGREFWMVKFVKTS